MSEYSPEFEMLANLYDRLGDLIQATIAAQGGKPPKVKPYPRPSTALDRVRERRRYDKHRRLVARVLPHKTQQTAATAPAPAPAPTPDRPVLAPGDNPYRFIPGRR